MSDERGFATRAIHGDDRLIRVSVVLEDAGDPIEDFARALERA